MPISMPPTVRSATPADIPAIAGIYAHAVINGTASFEIEPPDDNEMRQRMEGLLRGGYPYLVGAVGDAAILGFAYAGPYRPRPAYRYCVEDSVYIAPDAQGRGIGRLLLAALIAACEERGFRQMIAVIGDSAQAASIGLHRAEGFERVGTLGAVGYKHGRWLDSVLMQRRLGPGATEPPRRP